MNEKTKESKFLDAINKYAAHQQAVMTQEIEDYKNAKIEQATEQGLQDAYDLIREHIASQKAAIVNDLARQQLALRNSLFLERQTIRDNVFAQAQDKLHEFTQSEEYTAFLSESLRKIAQTTRSEHCVIYIAPADEEKRSLIEQQLNDAEVTVDPHILLGGVRVHCPSLGVVLDDTLDTRLADQYAWFNENSGLKVV